MNRGLIFVALGGMLGAVARFASVEAIAALLPYTFPSGTFIVNIVGSFVMGAAVGTSERFLIQADWRIFLTAGFCGGFTTMSSFAFENVTLLIDRYYGTFAIYSIATFAACLAAAFLGFVLTRP
ncbi:MAG: camphor resistance protein CrcB [Acidobacteria bacterium OLB17]|nr:MAG: camphor resistance protein CrcB [Acidobacteria bacterium OLB17]MCZ2392025.1 fluoride efflux transporter CrcB [Acidobacteriota bacterium]